MARMPDACKFAGLPGIYRENAGEVRAEIGVNEGHAITSVPGPGQGAWYVGSAEKTH